MCLILNEKQHNFMDVTQNTSIYKQINLQAYYTKINNNNKLKRPLKN
jgi:hypothetical protein